MTPISQVRSLVLCLSVCGLVLAGYAQALAPAKAGSYPERGKAITSQAFALLSSSLGTAMAAGGVSNALSYCSVKALPLTRIVGDTNQVRLARVTHRPRNPANQADETEAVILKKFAAELAPGKVPSPVLVTNADASVVFYSPIVLNNPLCLRCHGEPGKDIAPSDAEFIRSLYPKDAATGFKLGELRGAWKVEFAHPTRVGGP